MDHRNRSGRFAWPLLALCAAALLMVSLPGQSAAARYHMRSSSSSMSNHMTDTHPSDANIAAIVVAANDMDIRNAREAERISKSSKVLQFARQMVTDHTAVNKKATDLAKRLNLTPKQDAISRSLESTGSRTRSRMMSMTGATFDKAYVDNEVKVHQSVLDMIDNTLLPNAQNADLKKLIQDTRPAIENHLKMAKDLQSQLSGGSSSQ